MTFQWFILKKNQCHLQKLASKHDNVFFNRDKREQVNLGITYLCQFYKELFKGRWEGVGSRGKWAGSSGEWVGLLKNGVELIKMGNG